MSNITNIEKEKHFAVKKQRKTKRMINKFKKIRDNNIELRLQNAELYNDIYCELRYRQAKKVEIITTKDNQFWRCPTCECTINQKGYIYYCDFCGQALITPLNCCEED